MLICTYVMFVILRISGGAPAPENSKKLVELLDLLDHLKICGLLVRRGAGRHLHVRNHAPRPSISLMCPAGIA